MSKELHRFLATILFADMVGYSRMMDEDEVEAIAARKKMELIARRLIPSFGGEIIQFYGDGLLALFPNTLDAVRCAGSMQNELRKDPVIPVRMGIHTGEVARDHDNIYGDPVNIASRIESFSVPGSVLLSDKVYDDLRNQPAIHTAPLSTFQFKNIRHPIRLYALRGERVIVPTAEELRGKGEQKKLSIAVLPFVNMSPDPENEYFSDGMAEELLNALTKVSALRVTARTSSFVYKGKNDDVRQIGKELGVDTILEGSVRKAGNRVRITAQLVNTADGYHLLSESYDRDLDDIFAVQDEIATSIADLLQEKLGIRKEENGSLVDNATNNLEAYQIYLKGLYHWSRYNPIDAKKALAYFEQATELDPYFSTAWTAISICYSFLAATNQVPTSDAFSTAWKASEKALLLNDKLARAHCAQALVHLFQDWDFVKAELALARARPLAGDDVFFHYANSFFLLARGRSQEAIEALQDALVLDPIALVPNLYLVEAYLRTRQYEAAQQLTDQILAMRPDAYYIHILKGWSYLLQGQCDQAIATLKVQIDPADPIFPEVISSRGYCFARSGNTTRARDCLERLYHIHQQQPVDQILINKALLHFAIDEKDATFRLLTLAVEKRVPSLILILHSPQWQEVRQDPRFAAFRTSMQIRE